MKFIFAGGLNESDDGFVQPEECVTGQNFELGQGRSSLKPRPPTDLKGTAPNAGDIRGILQLVKTDNTETTLVVAGQKCYLWDGASTFTEQGTDFFASTALPRAVPWLLDDYIVITDINKVQPVANWDGTTLSTHTHNITGVTNLYAKYGIEHLGRIWLFNVKTDATDLPHVILASQFETPTNFDNSARGTAQDPTSTVTENDPFFLTTPDLRKINGAVLFNKELIVSTEDGRLYKLTGSDATTFNFIPYFSASNSIGDESIVNIGNDVMYVRKGGNIDLLSTTQTSGDVRADDASRFIRNTVKNLTGALAVYDQTNQKVLFFTGSKVLVYFKDMIGVSGQGGQLSPWSVYVSDASHGFNTNHAVYMRIPGTTDYSVYFGDSAGNIYDLNGISAGDNGTDIVVKRQTKLVEIPRKKLMVGTITYRRLLEFDFSITFDWSESYGEHSSTVRLKGPSETGAYYDGGSYVSGDPVYNGDFYYNQAMVGQDVIATQRFTPVGQGLSARLTFYASTSNDYQVDSVDL